MPIKYLESNVFSFFNSCSTRKCFDLSVVIVVKTLGLASKSVFVIRFACVNLALKTTAKVLNSCNIIYYDTVMIMISNLFHNFYFLTKLLTSGILFSTAVNAVFVTKLLTSGILYSNSPLSV